MGNPTIIFGLNLFNWKYCKLIRKYMKYYKIKYQQLISSLNHSLFIKYIQFFLKHYILIKALLAYV